MTKNQYKYAKYIVEFEKREGYWPTLKDVALEFGVKYQTVQTGLRLAGLKYTSYRGFERLDGDNDELISQFIDKLTNK